MKSSVITNEQVSGHFVENYRFKILSQEQKSDEEHDQDAHMAKMQDAKFTQPQADTSELNLTNDEQVEQNSSVIQNQPSFVEELLKRIDEMSGSIIKLQMQMENQETEFAKRLESETQRAKEEGVKQGFDEATIKFEDELKSLQNRFLASISKLDDEAQKFSNLLTTSENELSNTAVDIAKEVVKKEISAHSSQVAMSLCNTLLKEIKDAKTIEIKVSLKDYEFIKEAFSKSENIKVSSDDAINIGGVIVLSDVGNLDGTIEARFDKIRKIISE
ncbi:MAG: flagellar assembly protein FliH [Campylobacter sp.]